MADVQAKVGAEIAAWRRAASRTQQIADLFRWNRDALCSGFETVC
jgi:hypothetical protein